MRAGVGVGGIWARALLEACRLLRLCLYHVCMHTRMYVCMHACICMASLYAHACVTSPSMRLDSRAAQHQEVNTRNTLHCASQSIHIHAETQQLAGRLLRLYSAPQKKGASHTHLHPHNQRHSLHMSMCVTHTHTERDSQAVHTCALRLASCAASAMARAFSSD